MEEPNSRLRQKAPLSYRSEIKFHSNQRERYNELLAASNSTDSSFVALIFVAADVEKCQGPQGKDVDGAQDNGNVQPIQTNSHADSPGIPDACCCDQSLHIAPLLDDRTSAYEAYASDDALEDPCLSFRVGGRTRLNDKPETASCYCDDWQSSEADAVATAATLPTDRKG